MCVCDFVGGWEVDCSAVFLLRDKRCPLRGVLGRSFACIGSCGGGAIYPRLVLLLLLLLLQLLPLPLLPLLLLLLL